MLTYELIRSNRKTVAIHITKDATVELRAPFHTPKSEIDRFVFSKQDWINKQLAIRDQTLKKQAAFTLNYGNSITLQGNNYPLTARVGNRIGFDGKSFFLPYGLSAEEIKDAVIQIYKLVAKRLLTNKVVDYARQLGVSPAGIRVTSAKTRWGSCSNKNSISFSWLLVIADDNVIDYVVAHELAHIREHNHSDRFWAIVASIMPDYKARKKQLRTLQLRLENEGWTE